MSNKDKIKLATNKVLPAIAVFGLAGVAAYFATRALSKATEELKGAVDSAFDSWNDFR